MNLMEVSHGKFCYNLEVMRRVLTICRQDEKFQELFERAGLKIVKADLQRGFPAELLPVKMYAARPET